jgi:hypothetical protein
MVAQPGVDNKEEFVHRDPGVRAGPTASEARWRTEALHAAAPVPDNDHAPLLSIPSRLRQPEVRSALLRQPAPMVEHPTAWQTDQPFASPIMFFSASAISWTSSCPAATFMTVSYTASFAAVVA